MAPRRTRSVERAFADTERDRRPKTAASVPTVGHDPHRLLLSLQRTIGNRAVSAWVQRLSEEPGKGPVQRQPKSEAQKDDGLPEPLRSSVEALSGVSLDDVHVHYNSSRPARLKARAFTQGRDIHVAPGQEHHLGHEAWHVVQQAQNRVKSMTQLKDGVSINVDKRLEHEADVMGERAAQRAAIASRPLGAGGALATEGRNRPPSGPVQRYTDQNTEDHLFQSGAVVDHTTTLVLRADRLNKPTAGDLGKHQNNAGKEKKSPKGSTWAAGTFTGQSLISNSEKIPETKRDKIRIVKSIPASLEIVQIAELHHAELRTKQEMSTSQIAAAITEVVLTDQWDDAVTQLSD